MASSDSDCVMPREEEAHVDICRLNFITCVGHPPRVLKNLRSVHHEVIASPGPCCYLHDIAVDLVIGDPCLRPLTRMILPWMDFAPASIKTLF